MGTVASWLNKRQPTACYITDTITFSNSHLKITYRRNLEYRKFLNGPEIARSIAKRTGLTKKVTLLPYMVMEMCLMRTFIIQTHSALVMFEEADFKVVEYLSDLQLYWGQS